MYTDAKSTALAWQKLICSIQGIHSAKVVFDQNNRAKEIHILAGNERSAKALTRDVQSAIMATFEVELDYRIISIARIDAGLCPSRSKRLCYSGIDVKYFGGRSEIRVYLSKEKDTYEGEYIYTLRNPENHRKGVAYATLDAVLKYIDDVNDQKSQFELMALDVVEIAGQKVNIAYICDEQGRSYLGNSLTKGHEDDAIVRSVLDALNRRIDFKN